MQTQNGWNLVLMLHHDCEETVDYGEEDHQSLTKHLSMSGPLIVVFDVGSLQSATFLSLLCPYQREGREPF